MSESPQAHPDAARDLSAPDSPLGGRRASDVAISGISHRYDAADVLHAVDLEVEHGELMTLLGPSGSGKSTLLRIIGGLERPTEGSVRIGGEEVTDVRPERRDVGIVFQNYALFPHMTVAENVGFPLRMRRIDRHEVRRRTQKILEVVGLGGMEGRRPAELSGGQQQRVAVARALVFEPRVLLLDEPFGALDRRLREQLGLEVRRVQRELGITTVFVTHDQDEAFTMSTRIAVMGEGRILQVDTPTAVYKEPRLLDVARYLGHLNELPVEIAAEHDGEVDAVGAGGLAFTVRPRRPLDRAGRLIGGVRPEDVEIGAEPSTTRRAEARVQAAIFGVGSTRAQLVLPNGRAFLAIVHGESPPFMDGDRVWVGVAPDRGMLFDESTGGRVA